jgi:TNF receptor-associated protein 1
MWGVGRAGRMVGRSFARGARAANLNSKVCQPLLKMQISALPSLEARLGAEMSTATEVKGEATEHEFQAETRMLLDIVAKSLYSEKEVFIRELISNASDAIEKYRLLSLSGEHVSLTNERSHSIRLSTDKADRTLTLEDSGVGMTREEMVENLGCIARSGSKAFMEQFKAGGQQDPKEIIGQFGVGFYSAFMVADKIEVYSKSSVTPGPGYLWISDGSGKYTMQEVEGLQPGTKIVLSLRKEDAEFSDETIVRDM